MVLGLVLVACAQTPTPTPTSLLIPELLPSKVGPQTTPAPPGQWQHFSREDGLPYYSVTSVVSLADGIWAGTGRGAGYFDGTQWTGYTRWQGMLSDVVLDLAVDPRGTVWFGTDKGVSRFDGESWTNFTDRGELQTGYVHVVTVDHAGAVWFAVTGAGSDWAFGNGVARLMDGGTADEADDRWQVYRPTRERMAGDVVSAIVDLGDGTIWLGMTPQGTVRLGRRRGGIWQLTGADTPERTDDQWQIASRDDGLAHHSISALAIAVDGTAWIGTSSGLMAVTPEDAAAFRFGQHRLWTTADGLPANRILSLAVAPDGRIWVGTDAGLAVIAGGEVTVFTTADGLPAGQVRAVTIAPDGAVWVATPAGVAVRR